MKKVIIIAVASILLLLLLLAGWWLVKRALVQKSQGPAAATPAVPIPPEVDPLYVATTGGTIKK